MLRPGNLNRPRKPFKQMTQKRIEGKISREMVRPSLITNSNPEIGGFPPIEIPE